MGFNSYCNANKTKVALLPNVAKVAYNSYIGRARGFEFVIY